MIRITVTAALSEVCAFRVVPVNIIFWTHWDVLLQRVRPINCNPAESPLCSTETGYGCQSAGRCLDESRSNDSYVANLATCNVKPAHKRHGLAREPARWVGGQSDRRTDGRLDGWMDTQTDGHSDSGKDIGTVQEAGSRAARRCKREHTVKEIDINVTAIARPHARRRLPDHRRRYSAE